MICQNTAADVVGTDLEYICQGLRQEFLHLSGSRILITGGAGFLGFYLVQAILYWNQNSGCGHPINVVVVDNYLRGAPSWLNGWQGNSNLRLLKHDVGKPLPPGIGHFDYVIHAASIASPTYYRKHPIECMDANVNGLRSLLDCCRRQEERGEQVKGFLFFSSSEIYGDPLPEYIPTPETYRGNVSCSGPRACYDEAKRYGETLCVNFATQYGLPIKIVRPFNNYGPGLKITDSRVLPDFARRVLAGENIVMHSDGSPTRTFCYVADAIVGYYKALVKGRPGEPYNIGVEDPEISIAQLAQRVVALSRELFGYSGKVVSKASHDRNYLIDCPVRRCPAIAKARNELGYNPLISWDEGLRRSLVWYRDNSEGEEA